MCVQKSRVCGGHWKSKEGPRAGRHDKEGKGKRKRGGKKSKAPEENPEPDQQEELKTQKQPEQESKVSGDLIIDEDAEQEY